MRVLASGHQGVNDYARLNAPEGVVIADSFRELIPLLEQASSILMGQQLVDFSDGLDWLVGHPAAVINRSVVIWVGHSYSDARLVQLGDRVETWRGEADAGRLASWWSDPAPNSWAVTRRFAVVSLYPYPPVRPMLDHLSGQAARVHGGRGGWVDLDEARQEVSLALDVNPMLNPDYPFDRWKPLTAGGMHFIPHAPSWHPGIGAPETLVLERAWNADWNWQGWWLGTQVARRECIWILARVPQVILWADTRTDPGLLDHITAFCRLYQPHVEVLPLLQQDLVEGIAKTPVRQSRWPLFRFNKRGR